ncbi:MAG: hypothetical protein V3S51_04465 [Dehalococcoidia bacterium]
MVRHDNPLIQFGQREMAGDFQPALLRGGAYGVVLEKEDVVACAYGYEICALLGIIIFLKANGTAAVFLLVVSHVSFSAINLAVLASITSATLPGKSVLLAESGCCRPCAATFRAS